MINVMTTIERTNAYINKARKDAEERLENNRGLCCIVLDNGEVVFSPDYSDEAIESIAEDFGFVDDGEWYDPVKKLEWDEELAEFEAEEDAEFETYLRDIDAAWNAAKGF